MRIQKRFAFLIGSGDHPPDDLEEMVDLCLHALRNLPHTADVVRYLIRSLSFQDALEFTVYLSAFSGRVDRVDVSQEHDYAEHRSAFATQRGVDQRVVTARRLNVEVIGHIELPRPEVTVSVNMVRFPSFTPAPVTAPYPEEPRPPPLVPATPPGELPKRRLLISPK